MPADAFGALARGEVIALCDDADDTVLVAAAALATPATIAFLIGRTSGVLCAPLTGARADDLRLPPMVPGAEPSRPAWTVTVDLAHGTTTGISAADRCATVRALADPATRPADLLRPGHIVPVRTTEGGVVRRPALAEAAVDLVRLAGLPAVAVTGQVVAPADARGLGALAVSDLLAHRQRHERLVHRVDAAEPLVPTAAGTFDLTTYESDVDASRHHVVSMGELAAERAVPVRIHPTCLSGDVLGSLRCDCAARLRRALGAVAASRRGAVVLLERDPGRHHADLDGRELDVAAQVLRALGAGSVRLDDPTTAAALAARGVPVDGSGAGPASSAARPPIATGTALPI